MGTLNAPRSGKVILSRRHQPSLQQFLHFTPRGGGRQKCFMQGTKKVHPNRPRHQREFQSICECIYIHLHGVVWLYMKCLLRRHALIHTFIPMCPAVNIYILCMHMYIYTYSHPSGPAHFLNVIYNNILLHLIWSSQVWVKYKLELIWPWTPLVSIELQNSLLYWLIQPCI